jgi:hypothetical protein
MPAVVGGERYAVHEETQLDESRVLFSRGTLCRGKPHECKGHETRPQGDLRSKPSRG